MTNIVVGINPAKYVITFGDAHPGQSFQGVDVAKWKLKFIPIHTHVERIEIATGAAFLLSFAAAPQDLETYSVSILPASFTIKTSRMDPLEPQPIAASAQGVS
jgi:hypothetical protein